MKVPKVTSIVLIVLTSLSFLNFILKYYTYFVLIVSASKKVTTAEEVDPKSDVPHPHELFVPILTFIATRSPVLYRPWVLVTSSLIEEDFVGFTFSFMLIFYLGKYLENVWGGREFAKFILINILLCNLIIYFYYTFKGFIFGSIHPPVVISCMAINTALVVAVKQRIPNHYILIAKSYLRIKVTLIPFSMMALCLVLNFISHEFYISFLLSVLGFAVSWSYLRFHKNGSNERQLYMLPVALNKRSKRIQTHSNDATLHIDNRHMHGDRSEQFSLYTFFPYPLSIFVRIVTQLIFNSLVQYKVFDKKDFFDDDEPEDVDDILQSMSAQLKLRNEEHILKSNLFGVSSLNGASGAVPAISHIKSTYKTVLNWMSTKKDKTSITMDKRRKLALKELE